MAFLRYKNVDGKRYAQIVENYRENGKHKQRVLLHIGPYPTVEDAIANWQYRAEHEPWVLDIPASHKQAMCRYYAERVARLRALIAEHNVTYSEDEVRRLLEMTSVERDRRLPNFHLPK